MGFLELPRNVASRSIFWLVVAGISLTVGFDRLYEGLAQRSQERGRGLARLADSDLAQSDLILPNPAFGSTNLALSPELLARIGVSQRSGLVNLDQIRVQWYIDDVVVGTGHQLSAKLFERGDRIRVEIRDGSAANDSTVLAQASTLIANAPPRIANVSLRRSRSDVGVIDAIVDANDSDGDRVSFAYRWFIDGRPVTRLQGANFPVSELRRGQSLFVSVVASDGAAKSAPAHSDALEYANRPPEIFEAEGLNTERAGGGRWRLTCPIRVLDPDGDPIRVEIRGSSDGVRWDDARSAIVWEASRRGQTRTVTLRASDGSTEWVERDFTLQI